MGKRMQHFSLFAINARIPKAEKDPTRLQTSRDKVAASQKSSNKRSMLRVRSQIIKIRVFLPKNKGPPQDYPPRPHGPQDLSLLSTTQHAHRPSSDQSQS